MKLAMLGYGAQGTAEAKNLRKSSIDFKLGLRLEGPSAARAREDGFSPVRMEDALKDVDACLVNLPDEIQPQVYRDLIAKMPPKYLVFAHGFSTTFKKIPIEKGIKHILIAPKGAAWALDAYYETENALPGILAYQDESTESVPASERDWIEKLAVQLGCRKKALIWARFRDEAVCDLFSEQALLCGGVSQLLQSAYETLVENGYDKQTAYFETLFELKLIVDLIWKHGISGMRDRISPTARYGDVTRGQRIITAEVKKQMNTVLKEIESGEFAEEFLNKSRWSDYEKQLSKDREHPIEKEHSRVLNTKN